MLVLDHLSFPHPKWKNVIMGATGGRHGWNIEVIIALLLGCFWSLTYCKQGIQRCSNVLLEVLVESLILVRRLRMRHLWVGTVVVE